MKENIVIASFTVESEAYQALAQLKADPANGNYAILQGEIVKNNNGKIEIKDGFLTGATVTDDTWTGTLIGSLIGILGGPLGVLLGGSMGALVGAGTDAEDAQDQASLLEKAGESIVKGETAVLLLVQEDSEDALDRQLGQFQTSVTRLDAAEVAAEVEHAREVEKQVAKEAREKLRAEKTEKFKENVEKKSEELKEKFGKFFRKA